MCSRYRCSATDGGGCRFLAGQGAVRAWRAICHQRDVVRRHAGLDRRRGGDRLGRHCAADGQRRSLTQLLAHKDIGFDALAALWPKIGAWPAFPGVEIAGIARCLGCAAIGVQTHEQLLSAFDAALADPVARTQPLLIEVGVAQ